MKRTNRHNSRAIVDTALVSILLALITGAVLLATWTQIYPKAVDKLDVATCNANIIFSALTKSVNPLRYPLLPAACKHRDVVITNSQDKIQNGVTYQSVKSRLGTAQNEIRDLIDKRPLTYADSEANKYFKNAADPTQQQEWAINSIIARELSACWDRMLHGRMDAFDTWHKEWGKNIWKGGGVVTCVLCSTIKFSAEDPAQLFRGTPMLIGDSVSIPVDTTKKISSLNAFTRSALVQGDTLRRTYLQYFLAGETTAQPFYGPSPPVYSANDQLAVVYRRIARGQASRIADFLSENPVTSSAIGGAGGAIIGGGIGGVIGLFSGGPVGALAGATVGAIKGGTIGGVSVGGGSYLGGVLYRWTEGDTPSIDAINMLEVVPYTDKGLKVETCSKFID